MEAILKAKAPEERFNNLCKGDTLDGFEWFTITAARRDEDEGIIVQCEIGWVEFWSIYGWQTVEDNKGSHQVATPIHDEFDVRDAVRLADLREAFVEYSDYAGADQLDPYKPEEQTA